MRSRVLCLSALLVSALAAWPRLILHRPPPGRIEVVNLWWVDIVNRDDSTYHGLWLHGAVREAQQDTVYRADSRLFDLEPGVTTMRLADAEPLRNTWYKAGYQAFYLRTGTIPEGDYTLYLTLEPLGIRDSIRARVHEPGPPRLIAPRDHESLGARPPFFSWTAPVPAPGGPVAYELLLFEVLPGQTPEQAAGANPAWTAVRPIRATGIRYPLSCRSLVPGGRYAWQVRAVAAGRPDRRQFVPLLSAVREFWYAPESTPGPALPYSWDVETRRTLTYALHVAEARETDTVARLALDVGLQFLGGGRVRLSFSGPAGTGPDSLSPDRVPGSVPPPWWQPDSAGRSNTGPVALDYTMLPSGRLVGSDPAGLFLSHYSFDVLPEDSVAVGDTWTRTHERVPAGTDPTADSARVRMWFQLAGQNAESLDVATAGFWLYPSGSAVPTWYRQLEGRTVFNLQQRCTDLASCWLVLPATQNRDAIGPSSRVVQFQLERRRPAE